MTAPVPASVPPTAAAFDLDAIAFRPETAADADAIEAIHAITFGPGRYARTAFRIREGHAPEPRTSLVADDSGRIIGSVRLTRIRIGSRPALLLGPLAVHPDVKNNGVGKALMRRSLDIARADGHRLVLLVGDLPYYWPFGFRVVPGGVTMPGPVDPGRLLWAELVPGAASGVEGPVAAVAAPAVRPV